MYFDLSLIIILEQKQKKSHNHAKGMYDKNSTALKTLREKKGLRPIHDYSKLSRLPYRQQGLKKQKGIFGLKKDQRLSQSVIVQMLS